MTLTGFLKEYCDPVLRPAGLRRTGQRYEVVSDRGDLSTLYVERRPPIATEVGFNVGISLLPATQRDWRAWQEGQPDYRPSLGDALWRYGLRPGPGVGRSPTGQTWAYDPNGDAAPCGQALAAMLREHGVPLLLMGQDRRSMLASLDAVLIRFGRMLGTAERTRVLLLIDDGPSAELDEALRAVADDPQFLAWARHRLAADHP